MRGWSSRVAVVGAVLIGALVESCAVADDADRASADPFAPERLVAWCIVPFDAAQRTPAERAAMVRRLGLQRIAYDWRAEHVPTFEEEIQQYTEHGIEFFAFWSWHDEFAPLVVKHGIHPQFWLTNPSPGGVSQEEQVAAAAALVLPIVKKAAAIGCPVGLYNHGGWGGEPENLMAVADHLRQAHGASNVGIVYNFHHGHGDIGRFQTVFPKLAPYLLCLNLNGMADASAVQGMTNKILPIGSGQHEAAMVRVVRESGYRGPIGILDHRSELDAELSLRQNLEGLAGLLKELPPQP